MNLLARIAVLLLALSASALAQTAAPAYKTEFCKRTADPIAVKQLAFQEASITGFDNGGGLFNGQGIFNGGTCWWHSRLQRSALYLTVFRPDLPDPGSEEAVHSIFRALRDNTQVVEIGGFRNWREFTTTFGDLFQMYLNDWMTTDTFFELAWLNGLANRTPLQGQPAIDRLQGLMKSIVDKVNNKNEIAYVKLVENFPYAHAWLVVNAKVLSDGVDLSVIDSNFSSGKNGKTSGVFTYHYHYQDQAFNMMNAEVTDQAAVAKNYGDFNPFLQHEEDFTQINRAIQNYCNGVE